MSGYLTTASVLSGYPTTANVPCAYLTMVSVLCASQITVSAWRTMMKKQRSKLLPSNRGRAFLVPAWRALRWPRNDFRVRRKHVALVWQRVALI